LPSGPYAKRLKEFANCLNGAEKDRPFTLNDIAKKCGVNEQTADSYVYQNLGELNKEMIVMGKKVNKVTITKEYRGLIVDPPQEVTVHNRLVFSPVTSRLAALLNTYQPTSGSHGAFFWN
jgi:hypothetical protein